MKVDYRADLAPKIPPPAATTSSQKGKKYVKVLAGEAAIKNGAVVEANSAVIDLAAFNAKAVIPSAIQ